MIWFLLVGGLLLGSWMVVLAYNTPAVGWILGATVIPVMAVVGIIAAAGRNATFKVSRSGLEICSDWAGESFLWRDLDTVNARIVNFEQEPGFRPKWKKCGTAMPGYCSGSFSLRNKSDALVILTDKKEAVLVPTRKDRVILLSAEDNHCFLKSLKAHGETI